MKPEKNKKKSSWIFNLVIGIVFAAGAGIFLYPTISDVFNRYHSQRVIKRYSASMENIDEEDYAVLWEEAREYNEQLNTNVVVDVFGEEKTEETEAAEDLYETLLNPGGDGVMGYLKIPVINVEMAIYHGVSAEVLEQGCGHIEGTSLPIGGAGTHAVLSAHRGLPSAKLFTDLDQVKEGDQFYLTILDEVLAYEVDQILTVLPEDVEALAIEEGEDYVTLVTCTPYAINSHRLLVRGRRVEYVEPEDEGVIVTENLTRKYIVIGIGILAAIGFVLMLIFKKRKKGTKE